MTLLATLSGWFYDERFPVLKHRLSVAGITAFAICVFVGLSLSSILQSEMMRRLLARIGIDKRMAGFVTSILSLTVFIGLCSLGVGLAGVPIAWTKPIPGIRLSGFQLVSLAVWLVIAVWFSSASRRFVMNRFLSQSGLERSLQYALAQVTGYVALAIGLILAIENAGISLSAFTVFAGALGVGLGLGLQTVASNFISGLVLLTERSIKIGDRVIVDGTAGQVVSIRVRATTVVTNDGVAMIVPNSKLVSDTVVNWSYGNPAVRFRIPVTVAAGSDVDKVCAALQAAAQENPGVLADPAPAVYLVSFAQNEMKFELILWSEQMSRHPDKFKSDLNFAIERNLREAGI